ncbi:MAG: hypothetical protein PVJ33_16515 [Lysobacterales bacterium]|jgi:hypothetical protein
MIEKCPSSPVGFLPVNRPGRLAKLACLLLILVSGTCLAQQDSPASEQRQDGWKIDQWYVFTSLYTHHFHYNPDHVDQQKLLGLELDMENHWVFGFASFDNSFGQRSEYLYAGYKWALFHSDYWYFKLTGGLLHGYKEPYEDKIPFNNLGIAPAAVPTLGFQWKHAVVEINAGGLSVINVTAGIAF